MNNSFVNAQRKRRSEERMRKAKAQREQILGLNQPIERSADLSIEFPDVLEISVELGIKLERKDGDALNRSYLERVSLDALELPQGYLDSIVKAIALEIIRTEKGCDEIHPASLEFELQFLEENGAVVKRNESNPHK